jgi:hypothetical protein
MCKSRACFCHFGGFFDRRIFRICRIAIARTVGAENLRHQAILMNHAPGAVTPLNPETVQVGDAVGQRA